MGNAVPTSATTPSADPSATVAARRLGVHGAIPGRRSLVGGLLVGVAVLGTYAAATAVTSTPTRAVVVATIDAGPGHRLTSADVRAATTGLAGDLDGALFASPDEVVGRVLIGPVAPGEPLLPSAVAPRPPAGADGAGFRELSFGIERDHAVGGALQRGDRVDVLATPDGVTGASTTVLVRRAVVTDLDLTGKGSPGSTGRLLLTLALPDEPTVVAVVHAVETGTVTVVRSTASADADPPPDGGSGEHAGPPGSAPKPSDDREVTRTPGSGGP